MPIVANPNASRKSHPFMNGSTLALILALVCIVFSVTDAADARRQHQTDGLTLSNQPSTSASHRKSQHSTLLTPPPQLAAWNGVVQPVATTAPGQLPQVYDQIPTTEPVVFLTIDDGWTQSPDIFNWLTAHHLPATMFLTDDAINTNYNYFKKLQASGLSVEDHTLHHSLLTKDKPDQLKSEICQTADRFTTIFGQRPALFRPPYGAYNDQVRQTAAGCGQKAVIMWHATIDGGAMHYQDSATHLQSGDIVLVHFRPDFVADMQTFTAAATSQDLQVARLEDWIP